MDRGAIRSALQIAALSVVLGPVLWNDLGQLDLEHVAAPSRRTCDGSRLRMEDLEKVVNPLLTEEYQQSKHVGSSLLKYGGCPEYVSDLFQLAV